MRITIIATGFPSTETLNSAREQDLAKLVAVPTGADQESEIDLPPFLRTLPFARQRVASRKSDG